MAMNLKEAFIQGEEDARRTSGEWLVMAAKAEADAEQARLMGDLVMYERYKEQSASHYEQSEKCESRARWYSGHAAMCKGEEE
jgi:hypothetical protein